MTGSVSPRLLGLLLSLGGVVTVLGVATLGTAPVLLGFVVSALAVVTVYAIHHPTVLLGTFVVVEVSNLSVVTQLPLISALVGIGTLTVALALRDRAVRKRLLDRWTAAGFTLVGFYLLTKSLAVLGSQDFDASVTDLTGAALDCSFLLIVLLLVKLTRRPWVVAQTLVATLAVLSLLSLINEVVFDGTQSFGGFANVTTATAELITTPRYAGPLADSNFWGRQLILGLPLAGALAVRAIQSQRWVAVAAWIAAALSLLGGIYLTQSRGTMIATAVVVLVWVVASGRAARRIGIRLLPLVALVLFVPGVGDRLVVLGSDVFTSGHKYGVDLSVLERTAAQEMAWAMFRDHPIFGIGPNAFESMVPYYAGRVPTAVLNPTDGPHNLYAQLAGDSGIVGLVGWVVFVGTVTCVLAIRALRTSSISALPQRSLCAAVLAALVGWSFASIFLHLSYFRTFAIIIALALALDHSRYKGSIAPFSINTGKVRRIAVSGSVAAASAFAVLAVSGTQTHIASTTVTLLPTEQVTGLYAYALDTRSREVVVPTYAALIAANSPGATAVPDAVRGVVTISVEDADIQSARAGLNIAWANAYRNLEIFRLDHNFTVSQVGSIQSEVRVKHSPLSVFAALLTALAAGVSSIIFLMRYSARQSRRDEFITGFTRMVEHDRRSERHRRMVGS